MKISLWQNLSVQILAIIAQGGTTYSAMIQPKYKLALVLVVSILQAVTAYFAHQSNPDGTDATVAYVPKP